MPNPAPGRIKNALLRQVQQCIFCFPQIKNESFLSFLPWNQCLKNDFIFTNLKQIPFYIAFYLPYFIYFFSQ